MKIRVVSDIHVEHRAGERNLPMISATIEEAIPPHADDKNSLLVLAGDITSSSSQRRHLLQRLSDRFQSVLYVAGNHEHYGGFLANWNAYEIKSDFPRKNVTIAPTGKATVLPVSDKLTVIAATMWAPYGEDYAPTAERLGRTSDVCWIKDASVGILQGLYRSELESIKAEVKRSKKEGSRLVVVTHHVPSLKLRHPDYDPGYMDDMFMSAEAEEIMHSDYAPDLWIFGHTHKSWDIQIDKTRCVANPYGYPGENYQGWQGVKYV